MDNLLAVFVYSVPGGWRIFYQIVSAGYDEVGGVKRQIVIISGTEAHGVEAMIVIHRDGAFTHKRIHHADPQIMRKASELARCPFPYRAVARQDDRVLCV